MVTDWVHIRRMDDWAPNGENEWMRPILESALTAGYAVARMDGGVGLHHVWRFNNLLHMYCSIKEWSIMCLHHPRCVRPEDYTWHPDPGLRYDVASIPQDQLGMTPAWRVMVLSFWGSRPDPYNNTYMHARLQYGIPHGDRWSWHNFGPKFQITRAGERDDAVAILAKMTEYFAVFTAEQWENITETMRHELGADMWSFAATTKDMPVAPGLVDIGPLPLVEYGAALARVKVLLGLGEPPISPTPYAALCRGIPLVLPYNNTPTPEGWAFYDVAYTQHGPANLLGEPYVYTYKRGDTADLLAKLKRAYTTPIEPFIPPEMTFQAMFERVLQGLEHDWEAEAARVKMPHGGHVPPFPPQMMATCIEFGICKPFSNEMEDGYYFAHERNPERGSDQIPD